MADARGVLAQAAIAIAVITAARTLEASFVRAPAPAQSEPETIPAADDPGDEPRVTSVPVPGSALVRGRSRVTVHAPIDRVREVVLDFAHYPDFIPYYEACRVLGKTAQGGREVYMRVSALEGVLVLWARVEVRGPSIDHGVETYDAHFLDGNVKTLEASWRLQKIDDKRTLLESDVLLNPGLPVPDSVVNAQVIEGARRLALAYKARCEGKKR